MPSQSEFLTPTPIITTCTLADTEYTLTIPADTKQIHLKHRVSTPGVIRMAFTTGLVATPTGAYVTIAANDSYSFPEKISWNGTIYLASDTPGLVVECIAYPGR